MIYSANVVCNSNVSFSHNIFKKSSTGGKNFEENPACHKFCANFYSGGITGIIFLTVEQ